MLLTVSAPPVGPVVSAIRLYVALAELAPALLIVTIVGAVAGWVAVAPNVYAILPAL